MSHASSRESRLLSRRRFLGFGLASLAGMVTSVLPFRWAAAFHTLARWSDPETWGGEVPGGDSVPLITRPVLLDVDARVAGVVVRPGGNLVFHPTKSVQLSSTGNVVVRGRLTMRPEQHAVAHRLVFLNVKEGAFRGGGMKVLRTDVGLWVMDEGRLNIAGTPKLPWTRTTEGVAAGASSITLQADPTGWNVGDELLITPTGNPVVPGHHERYDGARVAGISGRTITLSRATTYDHPAVDVGRGKVFTPEVLNLTRNVVIRGARKGRAHVFIHSFARQYIRRAAIRYMGPRKRSAEGFTKTVLGRYGLHFHHCEDGSRGSVVRDVVVRDCGSYAFVPHMSHGITFYGCVSHNTFDGAYWWDGPRDTRTPGPATHDVLWDSCVASAVRSDPPFRGFKMGGFSLATGTGNAVRRCVAVGVQGNGDASGFGWPELPNGTEGVWVFEDCVAHNNYRQGIFTWQNTPLDHLITGFVAFHNGGVGISHGAYGNAYRYEDSILYGNREGGVVLHAVSGSDVRPIKLARLLIDQAGLSAFAITDASHVGTAAAFSLVDSCDIRGYLHSGFYAPPQAEASGAGWVHLLNCSFSGNELWLGDLCPADTRVRIQDATRDVTAMRKDQAGVLVPQWNASTP